MKPAIERALERIEWMRDDCRKRRDAFTNSGDRSAQDFMAFAFEMAFQIIREEMAKGEHEA